MPFEKGQGKIHPLQGKHGKLNPVRRALAALIEDNADEMQDWLRQVADGIPLRHGNRKVPGKFVVPPDPGKALDLLLKVAEFNVPKLQRTELAGDAENPLCVVRADEMDTAL